MRILVADDDPTIRDLVRIQLELAGYEVDTCDDGEQAVAVVLQAAPDLLVLDVMMPGLSGWDVLERVRGQLPVVVLSARDVTDDRHRARELGASAVLAKPYDGDYLVDTVTALLSVARVRA